MLVATRTRLSGITRQAANAWKSRREVVTFNLKAALPRSGALAASPAATPAAARPPVQAVANHVPGHGGRCRPSPGSTCSSETGELAVRCLVCRLSSELVQAEMNERTMRYSGVPSANIPLPMQLRSRLLRPLCSGLQMATCLWCFDPTKLARTSGTGAQFQAAWTRETAASPTAAAKRCANRCRASLAS